MALKSSVWVFGERLMFAFWEEKDIGQRPILSADSSGRRNTYYKLSMWSDDYDKEICTGWVYVCAENRTLGTLA